MLLHCTGSEGFSYGLVLDTRLVFALRVWGSSEPSTDKTDV